MTLGLTHEQLSMSSLSGQSRSSTGLSLDDRRQQCCWAQKGTREALLFRSPRPQALQPSMFGPAARFIPPWGSLRQCHLSPT